MNPTRRRDEFVNLSQDEVIALRDMLKDHERSKWLWGLIGRTSFWIGGVLAAMFTFHDFIARFIRALFGSGP